MSYPKNYTDFKDLYDVRDFSRTTLSEPLEDLPTSIQVKSTRKFPDQGVLTITAPKRERISDFEEDWACAFSYSSKTETSFEGLILFSGTFAPFEYGSAVTLNVLSDHHNRLAEEIITVQGVLGTRDSTDLTSISKRVDTLIKSARVPRAFFTTNTRVGFSPLTVSFMDRSTRAPDKWVWSFGDGETSFIQNPSHTFTEPGIYSIRLNVYNDFGDDEAEATEYIRVLDQPPGEISLEANPRKIVVGEETAVLATSEDSDRPNRMSTWDWILKEGVGKVSSPSGVQTNGLPENFYRTTIPALSLAFNRGGFFDISVIGRTQLSGYKGKTQKQLIEVVENVNLWDLRYTNDGAQVFEMGLTSKVFKAKTTPSLTLNSDILDTYDRHLLPSNNKFSSMLLHRDTSGSLKLHEYDGFLEDWTPISSATIDWQESFATFKYLDDIYVLMGKESQYTVSNKMAKFNLVSRLGWTQETISAEMETFTGDVGAQVSSVWSGTHSQAYILQRSNHGIFDRFLQFSPATGTTITMTAPGDVPGTGSGSGGVDLRTKSGQLVSLRDGIYLLGPIGAISKYNPSIDVWYIDDVSRPYFESNLRVSAAGKDNLAFIENHGSRYFAYFDTTTSMFMSLEAAPHLALEKEIV